MKVGERKSGRKIDLADSAFTKFLDSLSSKPIIRYVVYSCAVVSFFGLILIPPILGILLKWNTMGQIFENPDLMSRAATAISSSFAIALFVSLIDLVAGLPMAWFITRGRSRWLSVLDTFTDIPFVVPTVTLGYSLLLFWSGPEGVSSLFEGSLVSPGWLLIILLHFTFSFPIVVRVMVGGLLDYERTYEEAARTLGAAPLTADRTVTLPILKPSLIASFVLAFARSISETGATMMVAGAFENGPVLINNLKTAGETGYEGALVFVSFILIAVSCLIFLVIRLLGTRLKIPIKKIRPAIERKLSGHGVVTLRNGGTLLIFLVLVLTPSLFVALPAIQAISDGTINQAVTATGVWGGYWQSLVLSYFVGTIATILNVILGLPMAVLIARRRIGTLSSTILDVLVNIPMIVPSIALGISLSFFWKNFAFFPEIWLLILAHMSITYPYFVRSAASAVERISIDLEEAARTLGSRPFTVFRTIILPLTKYSLLAGAIMVFTRSVSETGATLAVVTELQTVPVLLVSWVKSGSGMAPSEIGLGCGFLIVLSFIILLILRLVARGHQHA
ncbi:MAG: ABC transporter permease subunit [Candidatus Bathyarchaeota archaeon]|nr:ABC transporter permease subunit [Candidatus Bathyarchaeota archaeon]MDH5596052.1 ABC transporter permease subunit [Candidatus Bathyarchaeota archaeon]